MERDTYTKTWMDEFKQPGQPMIIAGPCSAETPEQVMSIAKQLPKQVSVFRAGIWKPRTRPGGFEGVGAIGLKWLQEVKRETGLKIAVEIATVQHVELALQHDIDVLWIGARTTVNPFAVQEIADCLKGTDKIVLIKNPVNPDLGLWLGGVERLINAGISQIGVVHRGFSTYEKTKYRNVPEWQIAIDLKTQLPNIPIFCDPSHITGDRNRILEVSQQALDLNYDGLMIETHNDPDKAWSDAAQQVTPQQLGHILAALKVRNQTDETEEFLSQINRHRLQLDEMDTKILNILGKRMQIADQIGALKKTKNVAVFQQQRWIAVLEKMLQEGEQRGLTKEFITAVYAAIHQESIQRQDKIINK
ncbi:chorismate mutase [Flavobacterium sp. HSC-61S13]|uniref:chorismate mutase n=1 Tax=Flavobacterium sp. HSC-61S13 TaxID=2910963 RepID=UPI0020A0B417|nr:chorismate mutase [Flavobacterium sp. HSC-61S13]MCP1996924.1 chorismate mutase [Flavobacterium sp. HSC-61S13]